MEDKLPLPEIERAITVPVQGLAVLAARLIHLLRRLQDQLG